MDHEFTFWYLILNLKDFVLNYFGPFYEVKGTNY
jgi:hypothetical protein